ncbi:bacteriophage QLRG family, putative DNA packaging (plasmid) [Peptoclostridium acidaminophilum DSM 3953]|uniref:Bacteriophage QLRG family, putative DNA packaging n=1 Tax=Peptoclostridium acidaminophilum DSM 3953 TaxID=1286171 RepID=W8T9W7_PEPAC|nr:head-tail connector protein [Peptoclostridium acidaminophilum]AHM57680.1 bacteriophage QLRG family, putative DNA packaging [Peptoclostridium acidaminophilum DSM 3953]
MVVTLEEAKLYLRVDGDEDDTLIANFINAAQELCEGILRYPLSEFIVIPEAVKQSMLYAIANLYEQRENMDMKSVIDVMTRLLFAYRKDGW